MKNSTLSILNEKELSDLIIELKKLDFKKITFEEIDKLTSKIGYVGLRGIDITNEIPIFRAVTNENNEIFTKISRISYPPQSKIKKISRASIGNPIFYGSIPTEDMEYGRLISYTEVSKFYNDVKINDEYEYITVGMWEVIKPFTVIIICYNKRFIKNNKSAQRFYNALIDFANEYPSVTTQLLTFAEYVSDEFAKKVKIGQEFNYKISAHFSQVWISHGMPGILYPSIKVEGKGFNIAIKPSIADNHLRLKAVGYFKIFRKGKDLAVDCLLESTNFTNGVIHWKETDYNNKLGNVFLKTYGYW